MKEYFTVSLTELEVNQKLKLTIDDNIPLWSVSGLYSKSEVGEIKKSLYPNGISKHGVQYLSEKFVFPKVNGRDFVPNMAMIELTFELVRRNLFQRKPSRFTSVFACETIEQAKAFRNKYRANKGGIYKLNAENGFKADMSYLYLGPSILGNQIIAEKYWNGQGSKNPFWEILLTGEIKVIEKIY